MENEILTRDDTIELLKDVVESCEKILESIEKEGEEYAIFLLLDEDKKRPAYVISSLLHGARSFSIDDFKFNKEEIIAHLYLCNRRVDNSEEVYAFACAYPDILSAFYKALIIYFNLQTAFLLDRKNTDFNVLYSNSEMKVKVFKSKETNLTLLCAPELLGKEFDDYRFPDILQEKYTQARGVGRAPENFAYIFDYMLDNPYPGMNLIYKLKPKSDKQK